jgi:antitoxin component of RelBE/YafQ-DinJ toxin-antitoxin module
MILSTVVSAVAMAVVQPGALPFDLLARRENASSDPIKP